MDVGDYRIEEEKEEYEEESIDLEYENEAIELEQEEVEELEDVSPPWVSSWLDYADGKTVHGIMVIDDDIHNPKNKCQLTDCTICYQPWTIAGIHRICSLPCGHMYGFSCIKKWLLQSGKCPQCNSLCAYDDVVLLYPPHLCVADHQNASSTRRFPFTLQGAIDYNHYERLRMVDANKLWHDDDDHLSHVLKHLTDAKNLPLKLEVQWNDLLTQAEKLEDQAKELNDPDARRADALRLRADALRRRADALEHRAVELDRRADALERLADALERRLDVLGRRVGASQSNLFFFVQMYFEHHQKNTDSCSSSLTTVMQQLYHALFPSSSVP